MYNKNNFILLRILFFFLYYKIMDVIQWKAFFPKQRWISMFPKSNEFLDQLNKHGYTAQKYFCPLQCIYNHTTLN